MSGHLPIEGQRVGRESFQQRLGLGGKTAGWMEKLTESSVGSLEREKACRLRDAAEAEFC